METHQGSNSAPDQSARLLNHDGVHPEGASGQGSASEPGRAFAEGGEGGLVDQRGGSMAVQAMGSSNKVPGDDGESSPYNQCLASNTGGTAARCQDDGRTSQVSCVAASDPGTGKSGHGPGGLLQYSSCSARRGGAEDVSEFQQAMRQDGVETSEKQTAPGKKPAQRPGKNGGRAPIWVAAGLRLQNSGNTCYVNSFVHTVTWLLEMTGLQVSAMGRGANAWRAIMSQARPFSVTQLCPWCALQQGWRHEGRQHDVCEYIMFILQKCQDTPFGGSWEARVMCPHGTHVADSGSCEAALALEPSVARHWTLQDAVHEWPHQAHIHALKDVPQWLVRRVNRFHQDASGGANKIRSAMGWTPELRIPAFRDATLNVIEVRYRLRACIVHLGEHVMTGHYRAPLVRDADEVDGNELRYCDDGIKAKPLSGIGVLASDVYVLFFVRETPSSQ